jgi:hypothetical protein
MAWLSDAQADGAQALRWLSRGKQLAKTFKRIRL